MAFLRQYVAPLVVVLIFLVALVAVSARIFIPADMAGPAPIEPSEAANLQSQVPFAPAPTVARLSPGLSLLVDGLPSDPQPY